MNRRCALAVLGTTAVGACGGQDDLTVDDQPLGGRDPLAEGGPQAAACPAGSAVSGTMVKGPDAALVPLYGSVAVSVPGLGTLQVGRDEDGLFAIDPACTHSKCPTVLKASGLWECPCHNSRFTYDGAKLDGPASGPLKRYTVCRLADGTTLIDTKS